MFFHRHKGYFTNTTNLLQKIITRFQTIKIKKNQHVYELNDSHKPDVKPVPLKK